MIVLSPINPMPESVPLALPVKDTGNNLEGNKSEKITTTE